jgi:hypothetical protein
LTIYRAKIAIARPPKRAIELAPTATAGLLGTVVAEVPVLEDVVVKVTTDLVGAPVVEMLPVKAAVVTGGVMVVAVSVVLISLDVVEGAVVDDSEPLPEDDEVSLLALMAKGKEYWKTLVSESRVMRMPYVLSLPRLLSTAQEYSPTALSTPSVRALSVTKSAEG